MRLHARGLAAIRKPKSPLPERYRHSLLVSDSQAYMGVGLAKVLRRSPLTTFWGFR
jgi:hypothetical protein